MGFISEWRDFRMNDAHPAQPQRQSQSQPTEQPNRILKLTPVTFYPRLKLTLSVLGSYVSIRVCVSVCLPVCVFILVCVCDCVLGLAAVALQFKWDYHSVGDTTYDLPSLLASIPRE